MDSSCWYELGCAFPFAFGDRRKLVLMRRKLNPVPLGYVSGKPRWQHFMTM
jgi:hypothetical protein